MAKVQKWPFAMNLAILFIWPFVGPDRTETFPILCKRRCSFLCDMAFQFDGWNGRFSFEFDYCGTLPTTISADVYTDLGIITEPTLFATDLTCSYPTDIQDLFINFTVVLDAAADTDKNLIIT